jgi:hypothetical protein
MTPLASTRSPRATSRELQNFIELSVILSTGAVLNGSLSELTHTKLSAPVTLDQAAWLQILQTLSQAEGWSAVGIALPPG